MNNFQNYLNELRSKHKLYNLLVICENEDLTHNEHNILYEDIYNLHYLCIKGKEIELIKEKIAKIAKDGNLNHYINPFGCNLLFFVNNTKVLELLISNGIDIQKHSNTMVDFCFDETTPGTTAFHYACFYFHENAIHFFLKKLKDINLLDTDKCSPLGYLLINMDTHLESLSPSEEEEIFDRLRKEMEYKGARNIYLDAEFN